MYQAKKTRYDTMQWSEASHRLPGTVAQFWRFFFLRQYEKSLLYRF